MVRIIASSKEWHTPRMHEDMSKAGIRGDDLGNETSSRQPPGTERRVTLEKAGTAKLTHLNPWIVSAVDRISKAQPGNIQEIAASQIELLTRYYDEVLGQARRSFRWALIAAGVGLGFFLAAVGFLLMHEFQGVANISLISGGVIEVISAINFYLYAKTSAQLAEFHTRLDRTQRFLLANSLCESLDGQFKQKARLELIRKIGLGINEIKDVQQDSTEGKGE
jgi:Cyanobacterial TRADD-N associated 2-Transmembrane domain